jgi:hypothetical protein
MSNIQDNSHTFIARFWLEPREIKNAKPIWRGVVEHVASGQRRYLRDLDEVKAFVASYLQGTEKRYSAAKKQLAGKNLK